MAEGMGPELLLFTFLSSDFSSSLHEDLYLEKPLSDSSQDNHPFDDGEASAVRSCDMATAAEVTLWAQW
jgi:hypothetical protein